MTSKKLHPIQLESILVKELFVRNNALSSDMPDELNSKFKFKIAHDKFDEQTNIIHVGIIIESGEPDSQSDEHVELLDLRIHLLGAFVVDKEYFPIDKIEHWATNNAPLILYPYAREHVYSLTGRVLNSPVILPLLQIPTFNK